MLIELRPHNPDQRQIQEIVTLLDKGGLIICPTDTVYAAACKLSNLKGVETLARQRGKKIHKSNFSLLCKDLSSLSLYCPPVPNPVFKLMKRVLPGPFTFILKAGHQVPRLFRENKKTIGIRVPDNTILQAILEALGEPLVTTSIHDDDAVVDYMTDPAEIEVKFRNSVDLVIDGGPGGNVPSTVIDCTGSEPELIRQGKGIINP